MKNNDKKWPEENINFFKRKKILVNASNVLFL